MGKLNGAEGARQKREILDALRKLGEVLTTDEDLYLKQFVDGGNVHFARMNDASSNENSYPELHAIQCALFVLDVNVNALSAAAAKQIESARDPR